MRRSNVDALFPVLWLYGPPGVGKTTVAWELFRQLSRGTAPTAYVDIDQLGMCYSSPTSKTWDPEPASDPGRHRMKARNFDAVVANSQAAGARCLVVSGVVDPIRGADVELIPHAALTLVRLRSEPYELRQRLARRGRLEDNVDEVLQHADALDRNDPTNLCIDTTGLSVTDVLELVRSRTGGWPALSQSAGAPVTDAVKTDPYGGPVASPGEILWLCGATGVGKSTVGWQVYEQVRRSGFRAAFVDLDQIGFYRPLRAEDPGNHRLKAGNLAAIWQTYQAAGAQRLIVVGPVDHADTVRTYRSALPAANITVCRLHASRDQLTERVMLRGQGQGPQLPGEELKGQPAALLRDVVDHATADAEALERAAVGDLRINTDGQQVHEIVQGILRRTGYLDQPRAEMDY